MLAYLERENASSYVCMYDIISLELYKLIYSELHTPIFLFCCALLVSLACPHADCTSFVFVLSLPVVASASLWLDTKVWIAAVVDAAEEGDLKCLTGRRTKLPAPRPDLEGLSLWNLLCKNIGKDLSKISMPVALNEPLSMLQVIDRNKK
jgi:hypothetical protein